MQHTGKYKLVTNQGAQFFKISRQVKQTNEWHKDTRDNYSQQIKIDNRAEISSKQCIL